MKELYGLAILVFLGVTIYMYDSNNLDHTTSSSASVVAKHTQQME
jgi:hypothetical protein